MSCRWLSLISRRFASISPASFKTIRLFSYDICAEILVVAPKFPHIFILKSLFSLLFLINVLSLYEIGSVI